LPGEFSRCSDHGRRDSYFAEAAAKRENGKGGHYPADVGCHFEHLGIREFFDALSAVVGLEHAANAQSDDAQHVESHNDENYATATGSDED
jgi:hypothetical protein